MRWRTSTSPNHSGAARGWTGYFPPILRYVSGSAAGRHGRRDTAGERGRKQSGGERSPPGCSRHPENETRDLTALQGDITVDSLTPPCYGIAAGAVAIAVLAVANSALMFLVPWGTARSA